MSGRIIAVTGVAGGVGTSLLAGALALAARRADRECWLIDMDAERGDIAGTWDLPADRTVADLVPVIDEVTPSHLERASVRHESGVRLLAAQGRLGASAPWTGDRVAALCSVAAEAADVLVDLGAGAAAGAALLQRAHAVLLVCPATLGGVRRTSRVLEAIVASGTDERVAVVRAAGRPPAEVSARAMGRALPANVVGDLPWSAREARALTGGRWPRGRRRPLARAVTDLARVLP